MNILQITNSFYPVVGGQEKVVLEISKELVLKGHDVTVLTTDYMCENKLPVCDNINGIKIIRLKNKYWLYGYGYSPEAIDWLKKNYRKFDIVHCHGYNRHLPEFALKILDKKKPTIFSPHGFVHTKKNNFAKVLHDLTIGKFLRKANICTALTKLDFDEYYKLGVKKENIVEIPNGVDFKEFKKPKDKDIHNLKKKYNLDNKILLYVGRIHESKGLQYVIESIKDLECKLLIVGPDGGYKKVLQEKISKLKMENRVIFAGKVSDKELIISYFASDIFVLFSEWEGFGIVVIEAMATGLPVISSDRGALPFLVKNNFNGEVVKFKDVKELRIAISKLLKNKNKIINLGKNAKSFSRDFSWENIVKRYEIIYKNSLDNF